MTKLIAVVLAAAGLVLATAAVQAEDEALFSTRSLTPEIALKAASAALQKSGPMATR